MQEDKGGLLAHPGAIRYEFSPLYIKEDLDVTDIDFHSMVLSAARTLSGSVAVPMRC